MASLLDVIPAGARVSVRGVEVEVSGVSAKGAALLLARFPELRDLMVGKSVDVSALLAMGGDAVSAVIAAGCGKPGDAAMEAVADGLGLDEQADLLSAILKLTMPGGVAPFVEKLAGLGGILNPEGAGPGTVPATNSPKRSKS